MLLNTGNFGSILRPTGRQMAEDSNTLISHICVTNVYELLTINPTLVCDFITIQPPSSNSLTPVKFNRTAQNGQIAGSRILRICVTDVYVLLTTNPTLLCDFITIQPPSSNSLTPVKFNQTAPTGQIAGSRILPWVPPHGFSRQAVKSTDSHFFLPTPRRPHECPPPDFSKTYDLSICEFCGISSINIFYRSCLILPQKRPKITKITGF